MKRLNKFSFLSKKDYNSYLNGQDSNSDHHYKKNYEFQINFDSDLIQARFPPDTVNNTKRHLLHMFHRTQATLR